MRSWTSSLLIILQNIMTLYRKPITGCVTFAISPQFLSRISRSTLKQNMSVYLLLSVNSVRNLTRQGNHLENIRFKAMKMYSIDTIDTKMRVKFKHTIFCVFPVVVLIFSLVFRNNAYLSHPRGVGSVPC